MVMSSAEVFRTRQAVHDLVKAAGLHREAIQHLGIAGADSDIISTITVQGRIASEHDLTVHSSFLLAAAMPEADFGAFIGATAILLANRLQDGKGEEDLFQNWDAFHGHYMLADPPVRAAIMNGFRLAHDRRLVKLTSPPTEEQCLTFGRGDVVATLHTSGQNDLFAAVRDNVSPEQAGMIWNASPMFQSWQRLVGFRFLYERPASMAPPDPENAPLVPWR